MIGATKSETLQDSKSRQAANGTIRASSSILDKHVLTYII